MFTTMRKTYQIHCEYDGVKVSLTGSPRVKGYCHCEDCRDLLNVPFHSVTAWNKEQIKIVEGEALLSEHQHPEPEMKRIFCSNCGETLYNTNAMDWRVVSQLLLRKCNDGVLPDELHSDSHFFYARRIIDINDTLPKHD
ncbi:MAG: GFA family protein [Thiotrichales bacterium]|nr:MAG: GFA family protein [Thiotrichales bacterium]